MIYKIAPMIIVTVAASVGVYLLEQASYQDGFNAGSLSGKAQVSELKAQHEKDIAAARTDAHNRITVLLANLQATQHALDDAAARLAGEQREYRQTTDRLNGELARVTAKYRRSLDAQPEPLPVCVFTRDFVRLYDEATGAYPLPAASVSKGVVAPSPTPTPAGELDSGIGQRAFLAHHIRYAEQCRRTTAQLNKLIDAVTLPGLTP